MFILDNSVAMRWLFSNGKKNVNEYANKVLSTLPDVGATVPDLWHLEAVNVLVTEERRGVIDEAQVHIFLSLLADLPIITDSATAASARGRIMMLAKEHHLSTYDATYLELALREGVSIATVDKGLSRAALKAGVGLFLGGATA